jgi:hypothetical protein
MEVVEDRVQFWALVLTMLSFPFLLIAVDRLTVLRPSCSLVLEDSRVSKAYDEKL